MADEFFRPSTGFPDLGPAPGTSKWFDELAESLLRADRFSAVRLWAGNEYPSDHSRDGRLRAECEFGYPDPIQQRPDPAEAAWSLAIPEPRRAQGESRSR